MNSINHPYLVQHFLENSAKRLPDKVALICGDLRLTYQQINHFSNQLATCFLDMGVKRQDRIVIFLDNSAESVISLFAILKAGAVFIMLSPTMKAKKFSYILQDSGARALITHMSKSRTVIEALENKNELAHTIWCSPEDSNSSFPPAIRNTQHPTNHSWSEIFSKPLTFDLSPLTLRSIDLDLATIIYTSGSTGDPKGVMSAHYNIISAANSITTYLENSEDDIILNTLPLSFDYGLYQVLMAFLFGGTVVIEKSFVYPYRVLERLVQEQATGFPIVPTMAAILLQMADLSKFDFSQLRYITNTAASLPVSHIRKLQGLFHHAKIYSMYGLTECKRVSYLPPEELADRPDSVGIPIPNEEVFIVDSDGQEVRPNQIGELVVRGSNVMQGYWNAPQETKLQFRPGTHPGDTLLFTGDLFRKDNEGFLYFVGRTDDLIKTKGERVSPKEIENCLCELDGVIEAAVIGVADDIFGQAIKAFIVMDGNNELTVEKIKRYCQQNLEPFMIPKYVEFRYGFSKTASGKIDKKKLS